MTHALADAVASVPLAALDDLARDLWRAHAAGQLGDDEASAIAEAIHTRQSARTAAREVRSGPVALGRLRSIFPPKPRPRAYDRTQSLIRSRTIAASGPMPPALAAKFTPKQQATLGVVADELARQGLCDLSIGEIAARAGVSHRTAQAALRLAEADGLLSITERPRKGDTHLPNVVRVLSREWAAWLARRRPRIGCKPSHPMDTSDSFLDSKEGKKRCFREGKGTHGGADGGGTVESISVRTKSLTSGL